MRLLTSSINLNMTSDDVPVADHICDVKQQNKFKNFSWGSVFIYIMAIAAPRLLIKVALLQWVGAFVMVIAGILDRVQAEDRVPAFPPSYIVMPLWTGILVSFRSTTTCFRSKKIS